MLWLLRTIFRALEFPAAPVAGYKIHVSLEPPGIPLVDRKNPRNTSMLYALGPFPPGTNYALVHVHHFSENVPWQCGFRSLAFDPVRSP
jgi:hypothetical protein